MYKKCTSNSYIYTKNVQKTTFSTFRIFTAITMPSSVLFRNFVKFQDQSFHTPKIHRLIYIIDLFSLNLTYFNFNIFCIFYLHFFQNVFFFLTYCLLKKVIFINFPIQYFLAKKSGKSYFLEHS